VNELLIYSIMLDSLIAAYIHVIMLTDLQTELSQDLMCLCNKSTTVIGMNCTKNYGCESLTILLHKK